LDAVKTGIQSRAGSSKNGWGNDAEYSVRHQGAIAPTLNKDAQVSFLI
jgi:hypothetical protein